MPGIGEESSSLTSEKVVLTAEERRQRRIAKVLANAESRMDKILTTDSGERRNAPAMEGGDVFSVASSTETSQAHNEVKNELPSNELIECVEVFKKGFSFSIGMLVRMFIIPLVSDSFYLLWIWLPLYLSLELLILRPYYNCRSPQKLEDVIPAEVLEILNRQGLQSGVGLIAKYSKVATDTFACTRNFMVGFIIAHAGFIIAHLLFLGAVHVWNT